MTENIAFLRETKCNFFSAPCAFEMFASNHIAATKANTLVLTTPAGEKKSLSLTKMIKFDKKEYSKLMKMVARDKLMIITTKFNVYLLDIDMSQFEIIAIKTVGFKYAQNLNVSNLKYNCLKECSDIWLMACGRFLFGMNVKTGSFNLFKVFNDQVVDFCADMTVKNQIYVLTDKKLYSIKWENINDTTNAKVLAQVEVQNNISMTLLNLSIVLMCKNNSVETRDKDSLQKSSSVELKFAQSDFLHVSGIFAQDQKTLAVFDNDYIYTLSNNLKKIDQVVSIKGASILFAGGALFDLNRKSENSVNIAAYVHHTYTEEDKGPRFYHQSIEDRVDLAFSYMTKIFFDMKTVKNYNATIHNMLVDLCLGGSILKHRRFKEKVLTLFGLMKDFTSVIDNANKIYRVNRVEIVSQRVFKGDTDICGQKGSTSGVYERPEQQLETS